MNQEEFNSRYHKLMHAVQTGITYMMTRDKKLIEPKHLRVGIDSCHVSDKAMFDLLVKKGVITEEEYRDALVKAAEDEVKRMEQALEMFYDCKVTLM